MRRKIVWTVSIILALLLGASGMYAVLHFFPLGSVTVNKTVDRVTSEEAAITSAIKNVYDAVVVIETYSGKTKASSGTGFVYKKDDKYGYIVTNNHVISDGDTVYATFSDGNVVKTTILGSDAYGDIAVLRVDVKNVIQVATIGDSDDLTIGSSVFAIGAPISSAYSGTTTRGCISGINRTVTVSLDDSNSNDWVMEVIQTDAAINPGNSGGPLINLAGQVIGITSSKLVDSEVEGIGFAIPINDAMYYVKYLEKGETISRPVLGVSLLNIDDTYAMFYSNIKLTSNITEGAIVSSVESGSSADKAGIKAGDIITEINGTKVANKAELRYQLYKYKTGDKITVTYYRNNDSHKVDVTLQ